METRIIELCSDANPTVTDLLRSVAIARGCRTSEAAKAYFASGDQFDNPALLLTDFQKACARIRWAIQREETVTIFGDYDVDGQTSLVLMLDLLRASGLKNVRVFVPDRMEDDYGLTVCGVEKCMESHKPSVIISVDCGSTSLAVISDLKSRGVDTIVVDHHGVPPYEGSHPALAHLNPKDPNAGGNDELRAMSAAGLVYFFAEAFAAEFKVDAWDRNRAMILGGLGTLVDVMPLLGLNRALVKGSLMLANRGDLLTRVPGLELLRDECGVDEVNSHTYGFVFGPHLNATGRVATARASIGILAARTRAHAASFVAEAILRNTERKNIQKAVLTQAEEQVEKLLAEKPDRRLLVLSHKDWHPGVVGIVAGRIKEATRRPVFVCGWNEDGDSGFWKGSGRSVPGFDLGALVHEAVKAGALIAGGGHPMAAGIKVAEGGQEALQSWFDAATSDRPMDLSRELEVLGEADLFPTFQWLDLFRQLEPFGNANPRPNLWMSKGVLIDEPKPLNRRIDGTPWAVKANFRGVHGGVIGVTWSDLESAKNLWVVGGTYRLVLSLKRTSSNGRTYDNWDVVDCLPLL